MQHKDKDSHSQKEEDGGVVDLHDQLSLFVSSSGAGLENRNEVNPLLCSDQEFYLQHNVNIWIDLDTAVFYNLIPHTVNLQLKQVHWYLF